MIYSRRRLPHWVPDNVPVFVTWRLAGTLPRIAGKAFVAQDRALDLATSGPRWLNDERVASMIAEALHYGESTRRLYDLHAYVIMPNHVHVVWQPRISMPRILQWLKGVTANRAKNILHLSEKAFWQDESYDHWVRSASELQRIIRYVEWNPVKAGLAKSIEAWPWSSARFPGLSGSHRSGADGLAVCEFNKSK